MNTLSQLVEFTIKILEIFFFGVFSLWLLIILARRLDEYWDKQERLKNLKVRRRILRNKNLEYIRHKLHDSNFDEQQREESLAIITRKIVRLEPHPIRSAVIRVFYVILTGLFIVASMMMANGRF